MNVGKGSTDMACMILSRPPTCTERLSRFKCDVQATYSGSPFFWRPTE